MIQTTIRFAVVAALTLAAGIASARPELARPPENDVRSGPVLPVTNSVQAPELSPAALLGAVTLLVGGILVLRGRKAQV